LVDGLRPDPLGELTAPPGTLAGLRGRKSSGKGGWEGGRGEEGKGRTPNV